MHIKKVTSAVLAGIIVLSICPVDIFANTIGEPNTIAVQQSSNIVDSVQISITLDEYIDSQIGQTNKSFEVLKPYIDPNTFTIENKETFMQFLKVNKFREIDVEGLNNYLNNLSVNSGKTNIYYNQGQAFVEAAKKYNIDPIYLVAHTLHETGLGMSDLAQGYEVVLSDDGKALTDTVVVKDSNGEDKEVIYVRLKNSSTPSETKTVKVYNLFGIGAVDNAVIPGGTTTAYNNEWNSIPAAIDGSAKWINENYIYRSIYKSGRHNQDTLYKMKFDYVDRGHQYATDIGWATKISRYMNSLSNLYLSNTLEFEVPVYATPTYSIPVISGNPLEIKYVYNTNEVNVRTGPTTKFRLVQKLPKDTAVEIYGYASNNSDKWAITKINGEVRYIHCDYLTSEKPNMIIINLKDIESHWAKDAINQFAYKGYVNGYEDGTFKPNNSITRAEFVKMLNKSFGLTTSSGKTFDDTKTHWAKNEIDIAVTSGVCSGKSATEFKPNDLITREEAASMISNYKKLADANHDKLYKYVDNNQVSSWAKNSVEGMIEKGYMNGYSDGTFKAKGKITRAEAVTTLSRVNIDNF